MRAFARTAARPRESAAVGVNSAPLRRICSPIPGTIKSATACVDSGVLSRGPIPVPPLVRIKSTRPESANSRNCSRMFAGSSETRSTEVTSQFNPRHTATTAGPDKSSRSPLATVSLIVSTATRIRRVTSFPRGRDSLHPSSASLPSEAQSYFELWLCAWKHLLR